MSEKIEACPADKNQREHDLVRYMRAELADAGLITHGEHMELISEGSGSARRLEDYDRLRAQLTALQAQLEGEKLRAQTHEWQLRRSGQRLADARNRGDAATSDLEETQRERDAAKRKVKGLEADKRELAQEWAEDHTYLQDVAKIHGVVAAKAEGDSYGVPDIKQLVDLLVVALVTERDAAREELAAERKRYACGLEIKAQQLGLVESDRSAARARVAELEAERLEALRLAYKRTLDTQTIGEAVQALLDIIDSMSADRDRLAGELAAFKKETP